ncbi:carbamoyl-phosphate synthase (glutamine-hydrolyzing) cpa2 [Rhizophlyctis rosea]|uniref:Carbamoyl-phosphate synthase (Glutamine-hydrolyzing) cpa2 n=1 Tax=Rhizophlyctis rosea TaxID=64517 RepID=A0AAD5S9I1_9FUNG|nr:carbamoyl-phosphate synthase (glutamine-hydrolyzing) cpa2 [Rhizophlyctis rosea]
MSLAFGYQSNLNCGGAFYHGGVLKRHNNQVLGTPERTLELSEDRDLFAQALKDINIPVARSTAAVNHIGYLVVVRSAFNP